MLGLADSLNHISHMKSFTRIGLPILLVAGIVFGITFIGMYGSDDSPSDNGAMPKAGGGPMVLPLNFSTTIITPISVPPSNDIKDVPVGSRHLYYWDSNIEVGASGHYEFWCQNRNAQPVSVRVPRTNCQCAGVELAVVPPDAYDEYAIRSALVGGPLCVAPGPEAILTHWALHQQLKWNVLNKGEEKLEQTIPPAQATNRPQFALIRLAWTGKGEPRANSITADLFSNLPEGTPDHTPLQANTIIVPAFDLLRRENAQVWAPTREISFGELRENSEARQELFMASSTRAQFLYQLNTLKEDPCVTWSQVVPATEEEVASFERFSRGKENSFSRLRSLYKVVVTVRERMEVVVDGKKNFHQLDLGVLEQKLTIEGVNAGTLKVLLKGRVLGDVTILSGAESGKVDLGNAIRADQDNSRDIILSADRPGLDLTLLKKEVSPNYLKVKLEPLEIVDGRKKWRLRLTIPKESLYGSLPENSGVILQTNSPTPRRLTIPVRGMAYDAGGQKL